eukprot:6429807-Prymnesium_polylepis.1
MSANGAAHECAVGFVGALGCTLMCQTLSVCMLSCGLPRSRGCCTNKRARFGMMTKSFGRVNGTVTNDWGVHMDTRAQF